MRLHGQKRALRSTGTNLAIWGANFLGVLRFASAQAIPALTSVTPIPGQASNAVLRWAWEISAGRRARPSRRFPT
jgi:hypothetical protein